VFCNIALLVCCAWWLCGEWVVTLGLTSFNIVRSWNPIKSVVHVFGGAYKNWLAW
jgi:hypothetical protein